MSSTRLYDSITADVDGSPAGPGTIAFFDLDGTLIHGFSILSMAFERLLTGRLPPVDALRQVFSLVSHGLNGSEYSRLLEDLGAELAGTREEELTELGETVFDKFLAAAIYPESRALVRAHQARGHVVAILTSATRYQAIGVARELDIEHVICNHFETTDEGILTGDIVRPIVFAAGKRDAAADFAAERGVALDDCYFYTDGFEDLPLLDAVGHPRPLNPDSTLASTARRRDWPSRSFDSRGLPGLREFVRTGLVYGAFFSAAVSIVPTWILNQSRRDAVNLAVTTWGEFGSALAGIRIAISGEQYLWEQRPAVFLFNHQSAIDVLIIAKLLRRDFTAIAKQEIAKNPLVGPVFRVADTVFVDRSNSERAIEALQPVVRTLQDGLSIAIAPEGTRSAGDRLGAFKKGPFHIAMQAGVPVVPIVIHNATDVLPKGGIFVRPTRVRVDVLPPVDTSSWRPETVEHHVEEVRNQFVEALGRPRNAAARPLKRVK
ncbi:MAG: HAD-IB family hydrolase [Woeseiaceae bacterium]|nr:HAD-IB family hydrolase [Woeseiaceae bacterium]